MEMNYNGSIAFFNTYYKYPPIYTYTTVFFGASNLEIEVGTEKSESDERMPQTYFRLADKGGTLWRVQIRDGDRIESFEPNEIELLFTGDGELRNFMNALRIGYEYLRQFCSYKSGGEGFGTHKLQKKF